MNNIKVTITIKQSKPTVMSTPHIQREQAQSEIRQLIKRLRQLDSLDIEYQEVLGD